MKFFNYQYDIRQRRRGAQSFKQSIIKNTLSIKRFSGLTMRYYYSKDQLDKMLGIAHPTNEAQQHEYGNTGPGYMDTWLSLMEGSENSWLKAKDTSFTSLPKKKIILSDPMLTSPYLTPNNTNWNFLSSLIGNYDVYLWTPYTNFAECKPLNNAIDLFNQRNQIKPATKEEVETALSQQGLIANDFIVFDEEALQKINIDLVNDSTVIEEVRDQTLNLRTVNVQDNNEMSILQKGIDFNSIHKVFITSCSIEDIKKLLSYFPNLEEIEFCENFNVKDLRHILNCIDGKKITFNGIANVVKMKVANTNLKSFQLKCSSTIKTLDIPANVNEVFIESCNELDTLTLNPAMSPQTLVLSECSKLANIECFDNFSSLKKLKLVALNTTMFNKMYEYLKDTKTLEDLTINGRDACKISVLSFPECESMTSINLQDIENLTAIELKDSSHLKKLRIKQCKNLSMDSLQKMIEQSKTIEELELAKVDFAIFNQPILTLKKLIIHAATNIEKLDLSLFPNLEEIEFLNSKIENMDFSILKNLRTLKLGNFNNLISINISQNDKLRKLELNRCGKLNSIQLPKNDKNIDKSFTHCPLMKSTSYQNQYHISTKELSQDELQSLNEYTCVCVDTQFDFNKINKMKLANVLKLTFTPEIDFSYVDFKENAAILPNVEYLYFDGVTLPQHLVLHYSNLQLLKIECENTLEILDLSHCADLKHIKVAYCPNLKKLILPKNSKIESLDITSAPNLDLSLSNCPSLTSLKVKKINNLQISGCPALHKLNSAQIQNANIDLKNCTKLHYMKMMHIQNLQLNNVTDANNLRYAEIYSQNEVKDVCALNSNCYLLDWDRGYRNENRALAIANDNSPVSIFSFDNEEFTPDGNTELDLTPKKANGDFKVMFTAKEKLARHYQRINIYDEVKIDNSRRLVYSSKVNSKDIEPVDIDKPAFSPEKVDMLEEEVLKDDQYSLGYLTGSLQKNRIYALPSQNTCNKNDIEIYTNPPDAIKLMWHPKRQQFYMTLSDGLPATTPVEILYKMKKNPIYDTTFKYNAPLEVFVTDPTSLLPEEIYKTYLQKLAELPKEHPLGQIWEQKISVSDKIRLLADYCKRFDNVKLDGSSEGDIDLEFSIIAEHKGVCRHRSRAFMLLARLLGVPVNMVGNETHAFVDIPYIFNGDIVRTYADLGGGEIVDLTPLSERANVFQNKKKVETAKPEKAISEVEIDPWEKLYYDLFKQIMAKDELPSLPDLFTPKDIDLPPLIELSNKENLYQANQMIAQYVRDESVNGSLDQFIYIDKPEDFALYLKPYQIKDGKRQQVSGPLKKIIEKGGVIVVNWSNFSTTQVASYKSILDENPTILGEPIDKKVKVIGLMTTNTQLCAATMSRCKRYTLNNIDKTNVLNDQQPAVRGETVEVDLFHQPNWREKLLGKVNLNGKSLSLIDGAIIKAIDKGNKLMIYNPPIDDEEYKLLLYRINIEKRLLYNGEVIKVPDDFIIEVKQKNHTNTLPNVSVEICPEVPIDDHKIFLGMYNLHECVEQLQIDNNTETAETLPGFLANYGYDVKRKIDRNEVFYVTQSITEHAWQALLAHISEHYPQKKFRFLLAKGASIENVLANEAQPNIVKSNEIKTTHSNTYISNDPDYLTSKLYQEDKKALIVDVNRDTNFSHLIAELSAKDGFHYHEKGVLEALKGGKKVILNGEISPTLYQQLLPLLSGEKNLVVNGQEVAIAGTLVVVMPEQCKAYIQEAQETQFNMQDYLKQLPEVDQERGLSVIQLFDYAKLLPHRGEGMPQQPKMTQQRFKNMVEKLKHGKFHSHNPIKGLFHYDYLSGSKDYAYLNAMAKYLFDSRESNISNVEDKIRRIIAKYQIATNEEIENHIWQILNCFDGQSLRNLLGNHYDPKEVSMNGYPSISIEVKEQLIMHVREISKQTIKEKTRDPNKKLNQLVELINDPTISILFLKGQPGVGKSHAIRNSEKELKLTCYEGDDAILRWLNADKGPALLLLDEANMAKPGVWDFLKGINRDKKKIYYQGKFYKLKPYHKIIATGNPENYPERFYHEIFQQTAETILFKQFTDRELTDKILNPLLEPYGAQHAIPDILFAFHLIEKYNPYFSYSSRDLENLSIRFLYFLHTLPKEINPNLALYQAVVSEFSGMVYDKDKRAQFVAELNKKFSIETLLASESEIYKITEKHVVPKEKAYVVKAIEEDLSIRALMLEGKELPKNFYKNCILIEGDAGLGKSKLYKSILEREGFSENGKGPKKYYTISAGSEDVYTVLIKAFDEGAVVILDEFNLDKGLERLLNDLLTGVYKGREAHNPGFMVLASQNPGTFEGREPLSPALRNRTHFLYMDKYTTEERKVLGEYYGVKKPVAFANAEERIAQEYPSSGRMRTFFSTIEPAKKLQAGESLPILNSHEKQSTKKSAMEDPVEIETIKSNSSAQDYEVTNRTSHTQLSTTSKAVSKKKETKVAKLFSNLKENIRKAKSKGSPMKGEEKEPIASTNDKNMQSSGTATLRFSLNKKSGNNSGNNQLKKDKIKKSQPGNR